MILLLINCVNVTLKALPRCTRWSTYGSVDAHDNDVNRDIWEHHEARTGTTKHLDDDHGGIFGASFPRLLGVRSLSCRLGHRCNGRLIHMFVLTKFSPNKTKQNQTYRQYHRPQA
jgi:hypothetical protein